MAISRSRLSLLQILLALALPGAAQEGEVVVETIDVHVVNVDVVVTDRRGETVRGLTKEDFELFEDGKRVEISNFAFVERTRPTSGGEASALPPEEIQTPMPALTPPPLHLVVYVDDRNLEPRHRNRLLPAIESFLERRMAREDQVMVVAFDSALRVLQPFTRDRSEVLAALAPLRRRTTRAMIADSEAQRVGGDLAAADDKTGAEAVAQYEMFREAQREQALGGLSTLERFVSALGGLPGKKALLLISGGVGLTDRSRAALDRVTRAANASDVTFYALDGSGPETAGDEQSVAVGSGAEAFVREALSSDRRRTLERLADDTGGLAVTNTANFERGLERVGRSIEAVYSLGFSPRHERDGKLHRIEVKVAGRGLEVQHRAGYRDKKIADELAERTLAALHFDAELDNPLGVVAERLPEAGHVWGIALPLDRLALIPGRKSHRGEVRLLVASLGANGEPRPARTITLPIRFPLDSELPPAVGYRLELSGGERRLAIGAQDVFAGTQGFVRVIVNEP